MNNRQILNVDISAENKRYNFGADILRLLAMVLVVTVHATSFNGFTSQKAADLPTFFVAMSRYFSYICVPLFIMLSGFLCRKKRISADWYIKLIKILAEYVVCSLVIFGFKKHYLGYEFTTVGVIESLFNFSMANYSWYVNMYIGLFLLIPFLNLLYNGIPDRRKKQLLLAVLLVIFSVPATFRRLGWGYWNVGYPLMYYFIGAYIGEYRPKVNKSAAVVIIFAVLVFEAEILMTSASRISVENHNNLFCVTVTSLTFLLFADLTSKRQNGACKALRAVANTSLSFFLLSYMFDQHFSRVFLSDKGITAFFDMLPHLCYIVPLTVAASVACGFVTHYSVTILYTSAIKLIKRIKKPSSDPGVKVSENVPSDAPPREFTNP